MKKGTYDEEEKALILQVGDNYPYNLREGFRELATLLDRNVDCIASEYYYLKKQELKEGNYSMMLFSKKKVIPDRKIIRKNCPVKSYETTLSIWNKILRFLGIN